MSSNHLSIRFDPQTIKRLDVQSHQSGQSRSELVRTLVEEGLRMRTHPGITFRPGPTGRRPGLRTGPDVWEIIRIFHGVAAQGEEALQQTAERMGLSVEQVRTAIRYYAEYADEIDDWIAQADALADQLEANWRREQAILQR